MLHADIVCRINAKPLMDFHLKNNALCTLVIHKSSHPQDSDLIETNKTGRVVKFWKKPRAEQPPTELGNSGRSVQPKDYGFHPRRQILNGKRSLA